MGVLEGMQRGWARETCENLKMVVVGGVEAAVDDVSEVDGDCVMRKKGE